MITTINEFRKFYENTSNSFTEEEQQYLLNFCKTHPRLGGSPQFVKPNVYHFITKEEHGTHDMYLVKKNDSYALFNEELHPSNFLTQFATINEIEKFISLYENEDDSDDNDLDPAGGRGLHSHESRLTEGAVKRHWEEITNAIQAQLPLKYKSGENFGEAVPVLYKDNIVTFNNGINVIDMYIQTEVNNINESNTYQLLWENSGDGSGDLIAKGQSDVNGFANNYRIYAYGKQFILQVNNTNKTRGPLKLVQASANDVEKLVKTV